jgi:hypothetical protein
VFGQEEFGVDEAGRLAVRERGEDADLAVVDLAQPAIPSPGNPGGAFALLGETAFVDDQRPAALGEMSLGPGGHLPNDTGVIPVRDTQHMLHLLVVAAGNDVGHALHVAAFDPVEAANVALCAALDAARRGAEQSGKRRKVGFKPLANQADKGGDADDILRPSSPCQSSKCLSKTTACIIRDDSGRCLASNLTKWNYRVPSFVTKGDTTYQTRPGSSTRDYGKPALVTKGNVTYQTMPGSSTRDYSKPAVIKSP